MKLSFSGCPERLKIIENLRKKGDHMFNTEQRNENEELLVTRRTKNNIIYYCCPNCNGYFSTNGVRRHYIKCVGEGTTSGAKDLLKKSRILELNNNKILPSLKSVLAGLRKDNISQLVKYDNLLIQFGNKLCLKYKANYHEKMIRSKLRLLGRLLLELKIIDSTIEEFSFLYNPEKYDTFIEAVNKLSGLSKDGLRYSQPAVATNLGTIIKQIGRTFISDCIKQKQIEKKQSCKDFLELLDVEYGAAVNKTAAETQAEMQRQKNITLPTMNDIKMLEKYLTKNRNDSFEKLQKTFDFKTWKDLAGYTLAGIMLFNRRRVGEIERAQISDFMAYHTAEDEINKDIQGVLNPQELEATKKYVRFCIRGKLNRTVPVLLNRDEFNSIKIIINCRDKAGVSPNNPYIFGVPGRGGTNYLSACTLIRKFSFECGAEFPNRLRGTLLRKHIATKSAVMDLEQRQVSELANFMGHSESIHKLHYRISLPTQQIAKTSKVLEAAIGNSERNGSSIDLDESQLSSTSDKDDPDYNVSDDSDCPSIVHSGNILLFMHFNICKRKTILSKIFVDLL